MTTSVEQGVYVDAVRAGLLFADPVYQRDLEPKRVARMVDEYDRRLVGVLEVSERVDGRFAILDGQHRHAAVVQVEQAREGAFVVCQVHTGLTVQAEAVLFHELNLRRKALSWWDKWRARRAAGDERVLAIETVFEHHGVQMSPAARDGNIRAASTVELIVDSMGDLSMLDSVLTVVTSAFGRSFEGLNGVIMQAVAYLLSVYPPDELDVDRLVRAMAELPPRQILARSAAMHELHSGTRGRLCAAFLVERYNAQRGPRVEPFLQRAPGTATAAQRRAAVRTAAAHRLGSTAPAVEPDHQVDDELDDQVEVEAGEDVEVEPEPVATEPARNDMQELRVAVPAGPVVDLGICDCTHSARRHDGGDGYCLIGDCDCSSYTPAAVS